MDDADVLEAVRDCDRATTERIADRLSAPVETARERLAALEADGRIERADGGDENEGDERWTLARDPRIDESVDRMADRLGRERRG
jgi:predicted ArsR family transcriptional regulator